MRNSSIDAEVAIGVIGSLFSLSAHRRTPPNGTPTRGLSVGHAQLPIPTLTATPHSAQSPAVAFSQLSNCLRRFAWPAQDSSLPRGQCHAVLDRQARESLQVVPRAGCFAFPAGDTNLRTPSLGCHWTSTVQSQAALGRVRTWRRAVRAVSSASGRVWRYFSVVTMLAWPRRSLTTSRSAPPANSHEA